MPDLFHMDDFDKCMSLEDEALYCSITYEVQPLDPDNKSQVWNVIQVRKKVVIKLLQHIKWKVLLDF